MGTSQEVARVGEHYCAAVGAVAIVALRGASSPRRLGKVWARTRRIFAVPARLRTGVNIEASAIPTNHAWLPMHAGPPLPPLSVASNNIEGYEVAFDAAARLHSRPELALELLSPAVAERLEHRTVAGVPRL